MSIPGAFTSVDVLFKNRPEMVLALKSVAGSQSALFGPRLPSVNMATGLANDATAYTATITVDGVAKAISVVGSAAQVFSTLITEINVDLASAAVASLSQNGITVTSATTGVASTVAIVDGTLFAALSNFQTLLTAVRGKVQYVRVSELDANTLTNVTAIVNAVDTGATAWTSGSDSVDLTPISPATTVTGQTATGLSVSTTYQLQIAVDGGSTVVLSLPGKLATTFQQLVDDVITPALVANGLAATASFVAGTVGHVRFTSNAVGSSSTVVLTDGVTNGIIAALSAFSAANAPNTTSATAGRQDIAWTGLVGASATGLANDATAYTATITVDGVAKAISVVGSAAQTFTTLIAEINTDLGVAATASINSATVLRVVSATTGATSTVSIVDGTLFVAATGHGAIQTAVPGVAATASAGVNGSSSMTFPHTYSGVAYACWLDVLTMVKGPTGFGPLFTSGSNAIVDKASKPAAAGGAVRTAVYFDGSVWKFFSNDVTVGSGVTPPEVV